LKTFNDEYFDIIYIDGDHSYEGVLRDLKLSYNKVKKNGIICGHDYNISTYPQIVQAVWSFCKEYNLKINYLTRDELPTFGIIKL
jgi:hypothetical protein